MPTSVEVPTDLISNILGVVLLASSGSVEPGVLVLIPILLLESITKAGYDNPSFPLVPFWTANSNLVAWSYVPVAVKASSAIASI